MPLPTGYNDINPVVNKYGRKLTLGNIVHQKWVDPAALDADGYLTTKAGPNTATATYKKDGGTLDGVLAGVPDVPRNVVIAVTHASAVVALSGTITGYDPNGKLMTEAWSVTAGGTSKTFTGKKAFSIVSQVTVTAAADASTDSVVIGTGKVLGLAVKASVVTMLCDIYDGAASGTASALVKGSDTATEDPRGTYTPFNTVTTGHTYEVAYIADYADIVGY